MAGPTEGSTPAVPKNVGVFIVRLSSTTKSLRLYPGASEIPRRSAAEAIEALHEVLQGSGSLALDITREGLVYEGTVAFPKSSSFKGFAREFYTRNLAQVRFDAHTGPEDIVKFLSLVVKTAEELAALGGFEAALWELGVSNITVVEAATRVMDTSLPDAVVEGEEQTVSIDEILHSEGNLQTRDRRLLMRVLRDRRAVAAYLLESREQELENAVKDVAARIATLARSTSNELPDDQATVLGVIAEAILELQPTERGELYESHLLAEARRDSALAQIIRDLGIEEVVDAILSQVDETPEALGGLSRAVRNLALINASSPKDTVLDLAVDRMHANGFSDDFVRQLLESVQPQKITGVDREKPENFKPVEAVLKLVDMTPDSSDVFISDDAVEPLRGEVGRGTTDGDVLAALVTVASLEPRDGEFSQVMKMLEESVGYLVDAEEADVAADVAEALVAGGNDPSVSKTHRERLLQTVQTIAKPESLKKVTAALGHYRPDSAEYIACRRLIGVLGSSMIDSLLEVLADEPDMSARKTIVDLISTSASNYIPELGARLGDKRWYLVRNVVSILGSTKSVDALPFLQRTLRHADVRVRRETIRGLAAIRAGTADSMLAAALTDEDEQNVTTAARYLASFGCRSAVPALLEVARGAGRGSRTPAARVEAIQSLARIGEASVVPAIQELAQKRGFFGGGRDREVRAAATSALAAFSARAGAGR
jgi:hypothetical protein